VIATLEAETMQRNQLLSQSHLPGNHCKGNKSVVFPINELERPTIDAVLNSVPLFYDPITKQLVLQRDFELKTNSTASDRPISTLSPKFDRTLDVKPDCKNLTLSKSDSLSVPNKCSGRKLLETTLDDFTTQSKSPPKRYSADEPCSKFLILSNGKPITCQSFGETSIEPSFLFPESNESKERLLLDTFANQIEAESQKLTFDHELTSLKASLDKSSATSHYSCNVSSGTSQSTKENFKRHRRTPSYIHDFHNLIKNTAVTSKGSTTTASSAAAASAKLAASSLADAASCLSQSVHTKSIGGTTDVKSAAAKSASGRQLTINESHNQLNIFEQPDASRMQAPSMLTSGESIDDRLSNERDVEPLQLPNPCPDSGKTRRFGAFGHSLQHMFNKLRLRSSSSRSSAPNSAGSSRCASFANSPASSHRPISAMACCSHSGSTSSMASSACVETSNEPTTRHSTAMSSQTSSSFFSATDHTSQHEAVRSNDELKSTSALILEQRPAHLPDKPAEEQAKHRALYEAMLREAKRKEQKDARLAKKQAARKHKEEEKLVEVIRVWQDEVLPNFEAARNTKKVREMWFQGIPPNLRGRVWQAAIGNELNIGEELYQICLNRWTDLNDRLEAEERAAAERSASDPLLIKLRALQDDSDETADKLNAKAKQEADDHAGLSPNGVPLHLGYELQESEESIREQMRLDVSRTLPAVGLFQQRAPLHQTLLQVLGAYVFSYRPDVGYVQGMSFLAGQLLLHMDAPAAFTCFANLLNRNHVLLAFVRLDQLRMRAYYAAFDVYLALNAPTLHAHLQQQGLHCELYLLDWILTLFTRALPLDLCARLWDLLFRDGEQLIFRAALALLQSLGPQLLAADLGSGAQLLSQLQQHAKYLDQSRFFQHLSTVKMGQAMVAQPPVKCKDFQAVFQHFWQREITKH
jgi:hypothetical protein